MCDAFGASFDTFSASGHNRRRVWGTFVVAGVLVVCTDTCMRRCECACKLRHMSVNGRIHDDDDDVDDYDDHDVAVLW